MATLVPHFPYLFFLVPEMSGLSHFAIQIHS